jgi:MYXO-CTERM domain-containing protein
MLLRGNVIVQGEPDNGSQIIALFRDADPDTAASMELTLLYNTIIGTPRSPGQTHVLVNMRNDSVSTDVTLHNNLIVDFFDVAEPTETDTANWSIAGTHNWVTAGTDAAELTGTISGSDPGFVDRDGSDFRLTDGGDATGAADTGVPGLPDKEYYRDEALAMLWRPRGSANDLGAFERGTDTTPVGPYGEVPDGGGGADAGDAGDAADAGDAGPDAAEDTGDVGDGAWDAGDEGFDVAPDAADSGAVDGGTDSGDVAGDPGGAGDDAQNASSVDPTGEGAVGGDSVRDGRGQTSDMGGCGCGVSGGPEPRRVTFALLLLLALWRRRCV